MLKFSLLVALTILLLFLYGKYLEKISIFFPAKDLGSTPEQVGLEFKDIFFKTADNLKINGLSLIHI